MQIDSVTQVRPGCARPRYIIFEKLLGETPLEALNRLRVQYPDLAAEKLAYAGRLDPQATGSLLVLVGDECKRRDLYQKLDKIYTFDLLLGIETDTGDVLGIPQRVEPLIPPISHDALNASLGLFAGEITQLAPKFSAQRIQGKALWQHAKAGSDVATLYKTVTVRELELASEQKISNEELMNDVETRVNSTRGNFRQAEILENWRALNAKGALPKVITVFTIHAEVSSGTYIRQLAQDIGKTFDLPAMCWHIHRNEVIIPEKLQAS